MTRHHYITILLAIAVIVLVCWRGCESGSSKTEHTQINTDSIAKSGYAKGYEIAKLEEIGKVKDSIQTRYVTKWREYKAIHDTVKVVQECIKTCESAINTLQDYACHNETVSAHKDTAIHLWRTAYQGDSTNFAGYRDSVNAAPSKFWKGFKWGFGVGYPAGVATGAGLRR